MDESNSKIEKFFKQQFSGNIEPEPWNTPDDGVWSNIVQGLDKKPRRKNLIFFLPWILTGLSLLFSLYVWRSNENQSARISDLEERVEKCALDMKKTEISHVNGSKNDEVAPIISNEAYEKNINSKSDKIPSIKSEISKSFVNPTSNVQSSTEVMVANDNPTQSLAPSFQVPTVQDNFINDQNPILNQNETAIFKNFNPLEKLPSKLYPLDLKPRLIVVPNKKSIEPRQKQKPGTMFFGPVIGYNHWVDKTSGSFGNPLEQLLTDEKTNASFSFGVQFSRSLGRHFTINTGLHFKRRSQESVYLLHVPYTLDSELLNSNGEYTNSFSHSLPTGLGSVRTNLLLSRNQNTSITDKEIIDLDFSFTNKISSLFAPILVSYFPTEANNGFFINAGIQNEIVVGSKVSDVRSLSHHTFVKDKDVQVSFESTQLKTYTISALAGFGYQQKLWGITDFVISGNYSLALNEVYKTNSYSHKIDNISLNLGLMRRL